MPMEFAGADYLMLLAEVAVALAGFTGVVTVFTRRSGDESLPSFKDTLAEYRLRMMLESALMVLFFALLPFAFFAMDFPQDSFWILGSALFGVAILAWVLLQNRRLKRLKPKEKAGINPGMVWGLRVVSPAMAVVLILNSFQVILPGTAGAYIAVATYNIMVAGLAFLLLIFHTE